MTLGNEEYSFNENKHLLFPHSGVINLYLRKTGDSSSLPGLARTGAVKLPATERMFYVYRRITIRLVVSQSFSTGAFSVQSRLSCSGRLSTFSGLVQPDH